MRVSIDKRDPGYKHNPGIYVVRFNGEETKFVVTADEEKGEIVRYKRDENGQPVVHSDGKHYVLETVAGKVEVLVKDQQGRDLRLPKVKVERNTAGLLEVLVYSQIKPGTIRRVTIDQKTMQALGRGEDHQALRFAVSVSAGAGAEHCCATYGDFFDPSDVAKVAEEVFEAMAKLERTLN